MGRTGSRDSACLHGCRLGPGAQLVREVRRLGPGHRTAPHPAGAPVVTAAPINTSGITVAWSAANGTVTNYTLSYARFYGLTIANLSVGTVLVYNVSKLGFGLTYYFWVTGWNGSAEGPPSNIAPAQTDVPGPVVPPFPWTTLEAITTLSIVGSMAVSLAIASYVAGRRSRRTEGAATIALARSRRQGEANYPANRSPPPSTRSYSAIPRRRQGP